jgi:hypothetical protein
MEMLNSIERLIARAFAPVFALLRNVPDRALPRLFTPF